MGYPNKKTKRRRANHFHDLGQKLTLLGCKGSHDVYGSLIHGTSASLKQFYLEMPDGTMAVSWSANSCIQYMAEELGITNGRRSGKAGASHVSVPDKPDRGLGRDVLLGVAGVRRRRSY